MSITFGKLWLDQRGSSSTWRIEARPHVMVRLKRIFDRAVKSKGEIWLKHTDEICRELEWFMQRYPLEVSDEDLQRIEGGSAAFTRRAETFDSIINGTLEARKFDLSGPPLREYQRIAADLALRSRGLLIADDVGLGKSLEIIAMLTDPRTRPALIVTLTHLPLQWQREFRKFAPSLMTHIIKARTPYPLDRLPGPHDFIRPKRRFPDVLITNYHKLSGWAEVLSGVVKTIAFDEVQELRRSTSDKSQAAREIAEKADFRVGASVGSQSTLELIGGPFGRGWIGSIEDAYSLVRACTESTPMLDYDVLRSEHLGIRSRGWIGDRFDWKPVKSFIRHGGDKALRSIFVGGRKLVVTEDHAVYVAREGNLVPVRGGSLSTQDIVAGDDGNDWLKHGCTEEPVDVIELVRPIPWSQVTVDLSGVTRKELGLTAWQWQNCHKEASYGPRLPVEVFLRYRHMLPNPAVVYVGRGCAPSCPPSVLLSEWAYVLGFFLGDGWVESRQRVAFAVDNDHVEKLVATLNSLPLGLRPKVQRTPSKKAVEVRCTHRIFAEILERSGITERCFEKAIPGSWILTWSEFARRNLLEGLVDSDGSRRTQARNARRDNYTTSSWRLASDVHALVRSLGVTGGIHLRPPSRGGTVDGRVIQGKRPSYLLGWSAYAVEGDNNRTRGARRALDWSTGHFNEARLRSNVTAPSETYVYDLEMTGHPSFVANGVLVHNSATPIYNYGGEFFNVVDVICPDALGTREEFLREWCKGYGNNQQKASIEDPKAFGTYLREQGIMLRRTRKEVGRELPEVIKVPHYIECNSKALEELEEAEDAASELARIILAKNTAWEQRGKASREFEQRMRQATGIGKAPFSAEFIRMLVENGENPVCFCWHRSVYDILMEKLKGLHPVMYTGSESPQQKEAAFKEFVEGRAKVFLMSLRSGAGLDGLQGISHTVVFCELDWSYGVHAQCEGRVHRDGQEEPVVCYYLLSDEGSDPIVSEVLGLKRAQIEPVRNPNADLVEKLQTGDDHIKRLAEAYLDRHKRKPVAVEPLPENVIPLRSAAPAKPKAEPEPEEQP